jgi:uncharacterized Fe-S cluster protein YjdI
MQHQFQGKSLTITYDDEVCIHAANCVRSLPTVFDANRTPWIDPDGAAIEQVTGAVESCPSGALSLLLTD